MAKKKVRPKALHTPAHHAAADTSSEAGGETRLRNEHYEEIREKNRQFREAYVTYANLRDQTAEAKRRHERIGKELTEIISRGPNPQLELPFGSYDWESRSISSLAISDHEVNLLESGEIDTIGDLVRYWKDGRFLDEIKGIGGEVASKIADAFADYAIDHPEIHGEEE